MMILQNALIGSLKWGMGKSYEVNGTQGIYTQLIEASVVERNAAR